MAARRRRAWTRVRGVMLAVVTATVVIFPLAGAAGAWVEGPCDGSVVIDGVTYGPANDTPANPIVVPAEEGLTAEWRGSTGVMIKNHSGSVGIRVGPATISPPDWSWSGPNDEEEDSASGSTSIDEARELMPVEVVGLYEVHASHAGEGGQCTGMAMVRMEGNPLTTVPGAVGGLGLLGSAAGLGVALRGRKP